MSHPPPKSNVDRHRQLAPNASIRVSPLCLGAMSFGDAWKGRMGECNKETTFEILDYFISQGGNFIDTANFYQDGESEKWLGEWMAMRDNRDQIVLATKYSTTFKGHQPNKIQSNYGGNGAKSMRLSLEASLKNLQTSYIDLFYVHWWDYSVTIPELMHALNDFVSAGKILYLGISDTPAWIVSKANQYARDHGLRQFVVYQGFWNASIRDIERDIIPMCRDEGMGLCPFGTLGQGRIQTEAAFKEREENNPGRKGRPINDNERKASKVLEKIANAKETQITSIALAYVMHKTPYVFPIVGGRKLEHLKGNIAALSISLSEEDMREIDSAYEFDPGFPHTFLGGTLHRGLQPRGAYTPEDVFLTEMSGNFDWVKDKKPIPSVQL
ncbi:hypothetical protein BGZ46_009389 [Entomortierella lignicola]|nr:hypothetical protein BGZ46_009389 [Entomortierella lignicola]